MDSNEYRTLKPMRYVGLIEWYKFLGMLGFILIFPAAIERSTFLLVVSVALMGLATILYKIVRRRISAEELYSYGRKVLAPLPNDLSGISKMHFILNLRKGRDGSVGGLIFSAVWTALVAVFAIFVEKNQDGLSGPMIVLYIFIALGILIFIGSYRNYKVLNQRKQTVPNPEIVLDTNGISIPTFILDNGALFNEVIIDMPWKDIQKWEVCSGGDGGSDTYKIKTTQQKYEVQIIRGYIKDEIAFLDAVRRIGQQEILLRTDDVG